MTSAPSCGKIVLKGNYLIIHEMNVSTSFLHYEREDDFMMNVYHFILKGLSL